MERMKLEMPTTEIEDNPLMCQWIKDRHWIFKYYVYPETAYMKEPLEVLGLKVRAYNCLKRAGYQTIGDVAEKIGSLSQLLKLRGLGKQTAAEIVVKIFLYQYSNLKPEKRMEYFLDILELNSEN